LKEVHVLVIKKMFPKVVTEGNYTTKGMAEVYALKDSLYCICSLWAECCLEPTPGCGFQI